MHFSCGRALLLLFTQVLHPSIARSSHIPIKPRSIHRREGGTGLNGTITSGATPLSSTAAHSGKGKGTPITVPITFSGTAYIDVYLTPTVLPDWLFLTVEGPTTVITNIENLDQATPRTLSNGDVSTGPPWKVLTEDPNLATYPATLIVTAPWIGTQTWGLVDGSTYKNVTGVVPTTIYTNVTAIPYGTNYLPSVTAYASAGGRCHNSHEDMTVISKTVELTTNTELSAGQTITFHACNTTGCAETYTGPTSAQLTTTKDYFIAGLELYETPDMTCQQLCGYCYLLFPEVNVHYWPVEGADTSCLPNNNVSVPVNAASTLVDGAPAQNNSNPSVTMRALSKRDGSTLVSGDFTFTSPSVYIEFPSLSAVDNCGQLGPSFANLMRSYNPSDLSTALYAADFNSAYQPFDFRYADCPPKSVQNGDYWFAVANDGAVYNPVISQPSDLTEIHSWWASCVNAPFQGKDPPIPLTSQTGLMPNPTPHSPAQSQGPEPGQSPGSDGQPTSTMFQPSSMAPVPTEEPEHSDPTTKASPQPPAPTTQDGSDPEKSPSGQNDPTTKDPSSQSGVPEQSDPDSQEGGDNGQGQDDPSSQDPPESPSSQDPLESAPSKSESSDPKTSDPSGGVQNGQNNPSDHPSDPPSDPQSSNDPPSQPSDSNNDDDPPAADPPAFTFHSATHTADPSGNLIISGTTQHAGDPITLDGTPVTLPSKPASTPAQDPAAPGPSNDPPTVQINGATLTADPSNNFIISGSTHKAGDVATIDGQTVTFPSAASSAGGAPPVVTLNQDTVTADKSGNFVVDGSTFQAGQTAAISGQTVTLPTADAPAQPGIMTVGGQTVTADADGNFVVSGSTFHAGQTATIGGQTVTFPTADTPAQPAVTVGDHPVTADANGGFVVSGSTFHAGQTATLDGQTITFPSAGAPAHPAAVTIGGQTVTANSNGNFVISGTTFSAGQVATISGNTITFPAAQTPTPAVITLAGTPLTADSRGDFILSGTTFTPGQTATIDGTPVTFPTPPTATTPPTPPEVLTLDGKTYTADASGDFVVAGQTLTPGGVITANGQTVSLEKGTGTGVGAEPTVAVVDGSTVVLGGATQTGSGTGAKTGDGGIGNVVASGMGGIATGGGARVRGELGRSWGVGVVIGVAVVVFG